MPVTAADVLPLRVRGPVPSDEAFIYRTWLDALRVTGPMVKQVRDKVFFSYHHRVIEGILTQRANVYVAGPPDDDALIYGYLVTDKSTYDSRSVIHWLYVKATWRQLGVATRLIEESGLDPNTCYFTHWTSYELALNAKKEAARQGKKIDWKTLREVKAQMVADREASGRAEGDTRTLLKKWPEATYNPYLIGSW